MQPIYQSGNELKKQSTLRRSSCCGIRATLLALGVSTCTSCAQSPWTTSVVDASRPPAQALSHVADASPRSTPKPAESNSVDNVREPSAAIIVRGQEPVQGTLTSTSAAGSAGAATVREFDAGELIAVVGTEHILAGDMLVFIEPILEQMRGKVSPEQEQARKSQLIRQALVQYVEIKALYQEFFRDMLAISLPRKSRRCVPKLR